MNFGQKVLSELKKEINDTDYNRYIKRLTYDSKRSRSNIIYFYAPNIFIAKWVKTMYEEKLVHLCEVQSEVRPELISIDIVDQDKKIPTNQRKFEDKQKLKSTYLNPSLTFDSFIVGHSNQFAYTVATSVIKKIGKQYNPLFFYGGVGVGKTHLLQAIGNYYVDVGKTVIYSTLEQFMNSFVSHLRSQTMDRFRDKFRDCDLLLIDDIQFISGKTETQDEFFHTFNQLHSKKRQIVMTSDRQPNKIIGLKDRLKSRFTWGIMTDIKTPELNTKIAIIKKKCELDGIKMENEIINYIAVNMGGNIREIEGMLIKLNALSSMLNENITLEFTKNALKDQIEEQQEEVTIDDIVSVTSAALNVKPSEIRSKKRTRNVVYARRVSIYLTRNLTLDSMPQIATYFSMRDHTAISHAMKKINTILDEDDNFKLVLKEMENKIKKVKVK